MCVKHASLLLFISLVSYKISALKINWIHASRWNIHPKGNLYVCVRNCLWFVNVVLDGGGVVTFYLLWMKICVATLCKTLLIMKMQYTEFKRKNVWCEIHLPLERHIFRSVSHNKSRCRINVLTSWITSKATRALDG